MEDGPFYKALPFFNDFLIILKKFLLLVNGVNSPGHVGFGPVMLFNT